jgi:hypothetical protein
MLAWMNWRTTMTKIEELRAAHQYFEYLWLCRSAGDTYSIGSGDDIIATSTSESLARFTVFAHNNMPALLEAVECLQDVRDWLTTGKVDGVGFDQNAVIDAVSTVLEKLK